MAAGKRPPLSPREGWLSDGRQVLEVTSGELQPGEPEPLLKRRRELTREEAIKLWSQKRRQGWTERPPQWQLPAN